MNDERFTQECEELIKDATQNIMKRKGREYAGDLDRLANFKRGANNVGVNPETILYTYFSKHIDSLSTFIKDLEREKNLEVVTNRLSEPIQERIKDSINYLLLLNGLIVERAETENPQPARYPVFRDDTKTGITTKTETPTVTTRKESALWDAGYNQGQKAAVALAEKEKEDGFSNGYRACKEDALMVMKTEAQNLIDAFSKRMGLTEEKKLV